MDIISIRRLDTRDWGDVEVRFRVRSLATLFRPREMAAVGGLSRWRLSPGGIACPESLEASLVGVHAAYFGGRIDAAGRPVGPPN